MGRRIGSFGSQNRSQFPSQNRRQYCEKEWDFWPMSGGLKFLLLFVGHFRSRPGFALLNVYVQGLLSNLQRKNIEAMALEVQTS